MISLQWLIDLLLDFEKQGPVTQIGFLVAIVTAILCIIAWVRRAFRRGYERIDAENAELKTAVNDLDKALAKAGREQVDLQHAVDSLRSRLPDTALASAEQDIRGDNREVALERLQGAVTEIAPGFAEGCLRLAEFVLPLAVGTGTDRHLAGAERYAKIVALLYPERRDAPAILAEIEAKNAAAFVDHGDYATATDHADAALEYAGDADPDTAAPLLDRIVGTAQKDYEQGFYSC